MEKQQDDWEVHPRWWWWLTAQLIVVSIDACFVLLRPYSFPMTRGGHPLISPLFVGWHKYITIDYVYGHIDNAFGWGQTYMNLAEQLCYVLALYQYRQGNKSGAFLLWFGVLVATFSKTVLYALVEVGETPSNRNVSHNNWFDFLFFYMFMNYIWIVIPGYWIFFQFGPRIYAALSGATKKKKNNKRGAATNAETKSQTPRGRSRSRSRK